MSAVLLKHPAKAAELVCHDEQLEIWANDFIGRLSIEEFFRDGIDYSEGLELVACVKAEIKSIVEQAFTHPEAMKPVR